MPGKNKKQNKKRLGGDNVTLRHLTVSDVMGKRFPISARTFTFPDRLETLMSTSVATFNTGAIGSNILHTYKGNSILKVGPQVGYAGAFASNYPVGSYSLISQSLTGGSVSPYSKFRVKASRCKLEVISQQPVTAGVPSDPLKVILVPTLTASFSGTVGNNVSEQPKAVHCIVPAFNETGKACVLSQWASTKDVVGLQYDSSLEDPVYTGDWQTDPSSLWYWQIYIASANANNILGNVTVVVTIDHLIDFFARNNLNSSGPV